MRGTLPTSSDQFTPSKHGHYFAEFLQLDTPQAFRGNLVVDAASNMNLLFAGTNDVAILRSADQVVQTYQCLVERLGDDLPHLFFVAITPTPNQ